ncbi:MAG: acyltransferase [Chitinophagaceae bacterium]|nr:MAG: acyltransferase [Chitinophagaceae bacterium]
MYQPNTAPPNLLKTKQHFEILDGLRGIAAVAVLIFHFLEFIYPDYVDNLFAHSFLAVDFFFCLSGFVIAYAYDTRLEKIGFLNFIKLRLIRLHPLVVIGAVIGLLCWVFDPFVDLYSKYGPGQTIIMFVTSCLMIPYPLVTERYFNLFHLNPPTWSLFWEYIANIFYAIVLFRIKNKWLWIATIIAAIGLFVEAKVSKYLGVGWGGDSFRGGGVRVAFSFLAGILVYRSNWIIKNRLGFVVIGLMLLGAFMFPFSKTFNWVIDPLVVILYFPLIVALGAGASLSEGVSRICRFLGNISYPLYMIHYPFLWIFGSYIEKYKPSIGELKYIVPVCAILLIALAYLILRFVDEPVRERLRNLMKEKAAKQ